MWPTGKVTRSVSCTSPAFTVFSNVFIKREVRASGLIKSFGSASFRNRYNLNPNRRSDDTMPYQNDLLPLQPPHFCCVFPEFLNAACAAFEECWHFQLPSGPHYVPEQTFQKHPPIPHPKPLAFEELSECFDVYHIEVRQRCEVDLFTFDWLVFTLFAKQALEKCLFTY